MMPQHRGSVCEPLIRLHVDYDAICLVKYIAWGVQRDGTRLYTLEESIAYIGYRI